ncbi:MAG: uracil-DNA glycosylase [bacterium]
MEEGEQYLPYKIKSSPLKNFHQPQQELDLLYQQVKNCQSCKLAATRKNLVFGEGNANANLVMVGEAPGADEDATGKPFVGRAGKLLTDIITKGMELSRGEIFICNVLKCRPPLNRDPEKDEIDACMGILQKQLEIINPKVICTLGRFSAFVLLGKGKKLGDYRGKVHFYRNIPVVVTYHPSALLRNPNLKRPTWDDVKIILRIMSGDDPNQIGYW